jgi:2-polyprenyl-3-methyl-5-hydroxy-6-metoxy-1,4-benzoquinol methylase
MENKMETKQHWENVFDTKNFNEVSWYQMNPKTSIDLILSTNVDKNVSIIDVGGGDSNLVDKLLDLEFRNITVLDVSSKALEKSKQRLGSKGEKVKWVCSDIREFETEERFDIWHDRALLHFLIDGRDVSRYVEIAKKGVKIGGYLIVGTFSLKGPEKCSGLNVKRYSESSMKETFSRGFEHVKSFEEIHNTPSGASQSFIYNVFRRVE